MRIRVVCVGKLKETWLRDACAEYERRLSAYARISIHELPPVRTPEKPSAKEIVNAVYSEGKRILELLDPGWHVIACAIDGKSYSSEAFAEHLNGLAVRGKGDLIFVIGGSFGLSEEVLSRADERLSFSKMTFPHQLMRVILLEQLYRAQTILHGGPYHK